MPTLEYIFYNKNVECAIRKPLSEFVGDSPPRAQYCNIVTASVFCHSEASSCKFLLRWIFKTADPFFSKFGMIDDQPRAQKLLREIFERVLFQENSQIWKMCTIFWPLKNFFHFFSNLYRSRTVKKPIISIKIFTEHIFDLYFLLKENCLWVGSICNWAKYL